MRSRSRNGEPSGPTGRRRAWRRAAPEHGPEVWQVVDEVADAVVMIDSRSRITLFNRAACNLFGYRASEVIGQPLDILLPAGLAPTHQGHVDAFARGSVSRQPMSSRQTLSGRRADGTEFPIDITIGKLTVGGQQLFNAVIRDVSEIRDREAGLTAVATRFRALVEHASDGVVIVDRQGTILYASPYAEAIAQARAGELVGRSCQALVHPDDEDELRSLLEGSSVPSETPRRFEARLHRADRWFWAEGTATDLVDDPNVRGIVVNFRDVSERRRAEAEREAVAALGLEALAGATVEELARRACTIVTDVLDADAALLLEDLATEPPELILRAYAGWELLEIGARIRVEDGSPTRQTLDSRTPSIVSDFSREAPFPRQELLDAAGFKSSVGVTIAGRERPWGVIGVLSRTPGQFGTSDADFVQAIANVLGSAVERDAATTQLERQALHDPLTGLPNRALLGDRIEHAIATASRHPVTEVVVLFIDLDDFKRVNDTLGHNTGDALLQQVARRLEGVVRPEDTVARFGGDEFVVVTRMLADVESPAALADRILAALREPYDLAPRPLHLTASVGIAIAPGSDTDVGSLLRDADSAMYQAKDRGRDAASIFDEAVRTRLTERVAVENDLRTALANDELLVRYQPVVDSIADDVVGFEALIRWAHPHHGLMRPDSFIPIAESTNLIGPIGRWVLQQACRQVARWQRQLGRPDLSVSVNLSPRQLADPGLVDHITEAITTAGIGADSLRLEITETMIVDDLNRASGTLKAIAELGTALVIDDFGTGYSSLSYLKRLPIRCIKIDQSFVADIGHDPADRAIVAAVTHLADQLGVSAVAEGVETPQQLAAVQAVGCTLIQGYHYSPPLPPDDLERWLAAEGPLAGRHACVSDPG